MIDAVVLAGGYGTRLRDHIPEGTPKVLVDIEGTPFLWILMDRLYQQNVRNFIVSTGHLRHKVEISLVHWTVNHRPVRVRCAQQPEPVGTIDAINRALPLVGSEPFLVINGDTYFDAPLEPMISAYDMKPLVAICSESSKPSGQYVISAVTVALAMTPRFSECANAEDFLGRLGDDEWTPWRNELPWFDIGTRDGLQAFREFRRQGALL